MQGRDLGQFVSDFVWYLRNLLLVGQGNAAEEALEVSTDQLKLLQEKAQQVEEKYLLQEEQKEERNYQRRPHICGLFFYSEKLGE